MDFNFDDMTPQERAQLKDEAWEFAAECYMRHVVAVMGVYENKKSNGWQPQTPFCFSAMVIEVNQEWFLLSAGHAFQDIDTLIREPDSKLVRCAINDTFRSPSSFPPFDFDYQNAKRRIHYNSLSPDGLDYALIHIEPYYRNFLTANGIVPLTERHWDDDSIANCSAFVMAGFPIDSVVAGITDHGDDYQATVNGTPVFRYIERSASDTELKYARFVGQIRPEHATDIKGLSGGPIFCFNDADLSSHYVAGVQSSWLPDTHKNFAGPVSTIVQHAEAFLREPV